MISRTIGRFLTSDCSRRAATLLYTGPWAPLFVPALCRDIPNTAASRPFGTLPVDDSHDLYRAGAKSVLRLSSSGRFVLC
jgi:hypothetical protein